MIFDDGGRLLLYSLYPYILSYILREDILARVAKRVVTW